MFDVDAPSIVCLPRRDLAQEQTGIVHSSQYVSGVPCGVAARGWPARFRVLVVAGKTSEIITV